MRPISQALRLAGATVFFLAAALWTSLAPRAWAQEETPRICADGNGNLCQIYQVCTNSNGQQMCKTYLYYYL